VTVSAFACDARSVGNGIAALTCMYKLRATNFRLFHFAGVRQTQAVLAETTCLLSASIVMGTVTIILLLSSYVGKSID